MSLSLRLYFSSWFNIGMRPGAFPTLSCFRERKTLKHFKICRFYHCISQIYPYIVKILPTRKQTDISQPHSTLKESRDQLLKTNLNTQGSSFCCSQPGVLYWMIDDWRERWAQTAGTGREAVCEAAAAAAIACEGAAAYLKADVSAGRTPRGSNTEQCYTDTG